MRRPSSLAGLTLYAARLHAPRLATLALAVGAPLAIAVFALRPSQPGAAVTGDAVRAAPRCDVYQHWRAGMDRYDVLDSLDLQARDRGEAARGDHQVVRSLERFTVLRLDDGAMKWSDFVSVDPRTGDERPLDRPAQWREFRVETGEFHVVEPEPGREVDRSYRCRLRFVDEPGHDDYYAGLLGERPRAASARAR